MKVTSVEEENSSRKTLKCNKDVRTKKKSFNSCSLNSLISDRLDNRSDSTLNNQIIIKDVILHRNNPHQRLGLTLSYGINSKSITNIYIEQVEKKSIAHCQGKLKRGDQIIKINNHRVTNREQAIHLVHNASTITLQIIRFRFIQKNWSILGSPITPFTLTEEEEEEEEGEEEDSGVILACNTDFETNNQSIYKKRLNEYNYTIKSSSSLSYSVLSHYCWNRLYSEEILNRRCLSLNDLTSCSIIEEDIDNSKSSIKDLIRSQSLFEITTDNEKFILQPLPFNHHQEKLTEFRDNSDSALVLGQYQLNKDQNDCRHSKQKRRRYRKQRLKEENKPLITTDDEVMSELKQGRYWTKEQRKQQFQRSKRYKQRTPIFQQNPIDSTTEDFNLLNRIFLRENQQELKEKPYLAVKYQQQSIIEKEKLKKIIQKYPIHHRLTARSTTTMSINSTQCHPSTIII